MKTILIYTSPARGHLYPMMDVAMELQKSGWRVVVQTLGDEAGNVQNAGVEHRPIDPQIEAIRLEDYKAGNPLAQLKRTFACWMARARLEVADIRTTCEEIAPDLHLIDANTWGASAFAEARRQPWALFLPYCLPVPSRDAPAFGPGLSPPKGWLGRLRDRVLWKVTNVATAGPIRELNTLRRELGAPPINTFSDLFPRPELLLYRTAEPFDYPRSDWPANVQAIGPGLWAPPAAAPDWLGQLPRPRVLVSVSTELQNDSKIIEAALQGLRDEPGSVIVTTAALDPEAFEAPHENIRITRFLPHATVIPEVDVVVTHGGMGTTQRALAAGVPVCVVPWGRDQSETARRVDVSGAGCFVPRNKLTPERMRVAVQLALSRKSAAENIAQAFSRAGGAPRAVSLLKALLDDAGPLQGQATTTGSNMLRS